MSPIPETMRSLVAPKYGKPSIFEIMDMPVPKIENPTQVLIRVHACGMNTGDIQRMLGFTRFWEHPT